MREYRYRGLDALKNYNIYLRRRIFLGNKEVYDISEEELAWCKCMLKEFNKTVRADGNYYSFVMKEISFCKFCEYKGFTKEIAQKYVRRRTKKLSNILQKGKSIITVNILLNIFQKVHKIS